MPYTTRPAVPEDAPMIAAFNAAMALETESLNLDAATLAAGVRAVFENPGRGAYTVATDESGAVVGCLMVTYEWSDWRNGMFHWVQSVYVHPDHRRRGVFAMLYRAVQEAGARAGNVCGIRLYVERENAAAQKTYQSLGMSVTHYLVCEEMVPRQAGD